MDKGVGSGREQDTSKKFLLMALIGSYYRRSCRVQFVAKMHRAQSQKPHQNLCQVLGCCSDGTVHICHFARHLCLSLKIIQNYYKQSKLTHH